MEDFPVLDDDTGTLVLARRDDLQVIDRLMYGKTMHYPLLATREGVSLERTWLAMPASFPGNWHSASETAGFATPGCMNSHTGIPASSGAELTLQPRIFSPDNDGTDDLLTLTLRPGTPGFATDITVYDSRGRLVKVLANHVLCGSESVFTWDGSAGSGGLAAPGVYVIVAAWQHPGGSVKSARVAAVLAVRIP